MSRKKTRKVIVRSPTSTITIARVSTKGMKEIAKLLQRFDDVPEKSYDKAREILNRFVDGDIDTPVSAEEKILFLVSCALSGTALPGYATLDSYHIREIRQVLAKIQKYSEDTSQKRPLNFLMLASPGAGKSHFIRCIAMRLGKENIGAVTFNMVGLQRHEDLIPPLDAARNLKVEDKIPLLFLDEFDAEASNVPLLLPLLWDGEVTVGQHDLKLGKVVVVLAGSDPRLPQAMEYASSLRPDPPPQDPHHPKIVDLLSRINGGVLRIPQLSDPTRISNSRADKVCIAVRLLRKRFGPTLKSVPLALIRFIAKTEFRYGIRSIAHLIDLIPYTEGIVSLSVPSLKLPLLSAKDLKGSSLAYHLLSEDQALGVVDSWKDALKISAQIPISSQTMDAIEGGSFSGAPAHIFQEFVVRRLLMDVAGGQASQGLTRG